MKWEELAAPVTDDDIEWRIGRSGEKNGKVWASALAYVTNRTIMARLDAVCGPENWRNEFREFMGGVLCGISIRAGDEWVTKWDGAQATDIEPMKGGLSDSMKRAAVQWGIGRELYKLPEVFVDTSTDRKDGWQYAKAKGTVFYWRRPTLAEVRGDRKPPKQQKATPKQPPTNQQIFGKFCEDNGIDKQAAAMWVVEQFDRPASKMTAHQWTDAAKESNLSRLLDWWNQREEVA